MSERPILGLIDILNESGSVIKNIDKNIGLPITITPGGFSGGNIKLGQVNPPNFSSNYASAPISVSKVSFAFITSSMVICFSVLFDGSIVVSHNSSLFISPNPLYL